MGRGGIWVRERVCVYVVRDVCVWCGCAWYLEEKEKSVRERERERNKRRESARERREINQL